MKKATASTAPQPTGTAADRLQQIRATLAACARAGGHPPPQLMAVSKTFPVAAIQPLIDAGQRLFGENRVQEAEAKWPPLQARYPDLRLHLIGQLQSNKAARAVALFDAIHSVDRPALVRALAKAVAAQGKVPELLVQVNIGDEPQKGGVAIAELPALLALARAEQLPICGLMAVPPAAAEPAPYFALLARLAARHGLPQLSMGMSHDYDVAATLGATCVRVGSALFGTRPPAAA